MCDWSSDVCSSDLVGRSKALEWILLATHVTAEEAERRGLVYAIAEPEELLPQALALAERLKALSPRAVAQSKASIYLSEDADLRSARRFGLEALSLLIGSADWTEGIAAFQDRKSTRLNSSH